MPRELELDERLKLAASFVRPQAVFADVGCDHGRLSVYLMQHCHAKGGFACDLRPQPLEKARQLLEKKGLSSQVTTVLTDGLCGLEGKGITDVIIAGIGGEVLAHIIEEAPFLKDPSIRIILQPQSKEALLRRTLCRLGYQIEEERCIPSGRFLYTVMVLSYSGHCWSADDFFAYTGCLTQNMDEHKKEKLRRTAHTLQEIADSMKNSSDKKEEFIHFEELSQQIIKSIS